jgi:hypothetical protein
MEISNGTRNMLFILFMFMLIDVETISMKCELKCVLCGEIYY